MIDIREFVAPLIGYGLLVALVLLVVVLVRGFLFNLIRRSLAKASERERSIRFQTLQGVLLNFAGYLVGLIGAVTILNLLGVPIGPILGANGIVGLAVGFGAQTLVRDIITGFFILLEDQFGVGETVAAAGVFGTVEDVGFRVTKIRDFSGTLHVIANGNITQTANHSRGAQRLLVDIDIAYEESIAQAREVLLDVCRRFQDTNDSIVEGPEPIGVQSLNDSSITLRIIGKTLAGQQWSAARALQQMIVEAFAEHGIEIPYPRQVLVPPTATGVGGGLEVNVQGQADRM